MTLEQIGFLVLATVTLSSALGAVLLKNLTHALLSLVLSFFGSAGLFFSLHAEFIGVVQILVYVGAIAVLFVFAIVLTREAQGDAGTLRHLGGRGKILGGLTAVVVGALLVRMILLAPHKLLTDAARAQEGGGTVGEIGMALMTSYIVPFEVASLLLTAALVGAIVIALNEVKPAASTPAASSPPLAPPIGRVR